MLVDALAESVAEVEAAALFDTMAHRIALVQ